jgi:hypothetical protein
MVEQQHQWDHQRGSADGHCMNNMVPTIPLQLACGLLWFPVQALLSALAYQI